MIVTLETPSDPCSVINSLSENPRALSITSWAESKFVINCRAFRKYPQMMCELQELLSVELNLIGLTQKSDSK